MLTTLLIETYAMVTTTRIANEGVGQSVYLSHSGIRLIGTHRRTKDADSCTTRTTWTMRRLDGSTSFKPLLSLERKMLIEQLCVFE